ncbi:hypothetical protein B0T18DRAFT_323959 [Schizothecium vesticola]|uniref:Uncharacterized protein n=1 Tax=Schizothecium vesticola TaxID=314040 RepID=A0AA40F226_9PEZI|nr:hypothetical protein B0T18DRAFT_323959 [Schizothecium vesticola]
MFSTCKQTYPCHQRTALSHALLKQKRPSKKKTYNTRDSLVVTDPTTSLAVTGLSMGERTGSRAFQYLWSYVSGNGGITDRIEGTWTLRGGGRKNSLNTHQGRSRMIFGQSQYIKKHARHGGSSRNLYLFSPIQVSLHDNWQVVKPEHKVS